MIQNARRFRSRITELRGAAVAFSLVLPLCMVAAIPSRAQDAKPEPATMAQDADPGWEVATVKPGDPNSQRQTFTVRGRHVVIVKQSVEAMLMVGYGLQKNQIANAPEWVRTEFFDVDGVPDVAGQPSVQQFQSMVRKLLVERFGLKMHREQREMSVYALRVAKDGPKLKDAGNPGSLGNQQVHDGEGYRALEFTNVSMQDLTLMMLYYLDRPLVDQTELKGRYDLNLKYTYDETRAPTDGTAPPSLFTAVQEQLGLKLEAVKAPAEALVVDHIERPSAN